MNKEQPLILDERTRQAVEELESTIRERYPSTTFELSRAADDPDSIHLLATADVDDPDEVGDLVIDRVVELQVEEGIPLHVIPLRTPERILADMQAQAAGSTRPPRRTSLWRRGPLSRTASNR